MEETEGFANNFENGSSSDGRPPNPLAAAYRQCLSTNSPMVAPFKKSLIRHPSLQVKTKISDVSAELGHVLEDCESDFLSNLRSGAWADVGIRTSMEDVYVCVDDIKRDYGVKSLINRPSAFYGVFIHC